LRTNESPPLSIYSKKFSNSPLQRLNSPFLNSANIQLYVKRDDLLHPEFGGNKWRKLKYNLIFAQKNHFTTLLTFGGAWSNHIYATAAAGKHFGFNTIGIIRGERSKTPSETLIFAEKCGMQLHYVSRAEYKQKHQPDFLQSIKKQFNDPYILPEGGSNLLAIKGCEEIIDEINLAMTEPFDAICCASGTGTTLA
jgi:1-aminocyclopropane-1-carboxylate deaminase/D-cysteine desulfhydrase-like pyridoxal-dependent ACC family enzyme